MRVPLKMVIVGVPLIAVLVTAAVFGALSYRFAHTSLEATIAATLSAAATARRDAIVQRHEFWLRRAELLAEDAAVADWVRSGARADAEPPISLTSAAAPHQQEVVGVVALDRRGRVLFSSAQHGVDVNAWVDGASFRRIRKVTDLGARETSFGAAAGIVAPIGRGRVVGFVITLFNMEGVFAVTRDRSGLGATGETMVVRVEGGDRLTYLSPQRFHPEDEPDDAAAATALLTAISSGKMERLVDYRGAETVVAARHVPGADWIVLAKMDAEEARGSLARLLTAFGLAGLVVVLAIAVCAMVACAHALRQTRALRDAATRLGAGDYDVSAPSGTVSELNALADEFNRMRDGVLTALEGERSARIAASAASEAKSRFLATMSHEIRTPMNGVLGAAELLSRTPQDAHQRMLTETIVGSGEALLVVINDILDYSRLDAKAPSLEHEPFRPRDVVEGVASLAARLADAKDLKIVADICESADAALIGDEGRLRQILVNLVGNAVKFTESGHVLIIAKLEGAALRISVKDTGPGIPEDRREAIFEAFEQVDNSVTRQFEGSGLGLAISRRLARTMGGEITVSSELGHGSCFTLTVELPFAEEGAPADAPRLDGVSVAVAEPLAEAADSLRRILHGAGATLVDEARPDAADVIIVGDLDTVEMLRQTPAPGALLFHGAVDARVMALTQDGALAEALPRPSPAHRLVETVARVAAQRRSSPVFADMRVVIALDDPTDRAAAEEALSRLGAQVTSCALQAAPEIIACEDPDLALLDLADPERRGLHILSEIRALPQIGPRVSVIMLAPRLSPELRRRAAAADGHLATTFTDQDLVDEGLAALANRRADGADAA